MRIDFEPIGQHRRRLEQLTGEFDLAEARMQKLVEGTPVGQLDLGVITDAIGKRLEIVRAQLTLARQFIPPDPRSSPDFLIKTWGHMAASPEDYRGPLSIHEKNDLAEELNRRVRDRQARIDSDREQIL